MRRRLAASTIHRPRLLPLPARALVAVALLGSAPSACDRAPAEHRPDEVLRTELGMSDSDEVHRVEILGGETERAEPDSVELPPGAWVDFVSGDFLVHEIRFDAEAMAAAPRAFLEETDQMASPPLVDRGQRFLVSFADAPEGRYPFRIEGNGATQRGVVVVRTRR